MSADGTQNNGGDTSPRQRRSSITQAALSNLFQRGPPSGSSGPPFPANDAQRRRLSVTTLGLSGTNGNGGGASALGIRRGSMSTNSNNSDSIDENVFEDDDAPGGGPKTAPTTPFVRRMSYGGSAMRTYRPAGSPGNDQQGFNWSEQLRSRAESTVASGPRPSFSFASSSSSSQNGSSQHDRAKSVSDLPPPPVQAPVTAAKPIKERQKPDAFQERILKGDFYMD